MNPYYPLIILAVASDDKPVYKKLRAVYEKIIDANKQVKIFLVYGAPISFTPKEYDLFFPEVKESYYPGMVLKTIKAMEHVTNTYNYDFLLRTNISTFWLLERVLNRLKTLPQKNMYTGACRRCYINGKISDNYISGTSLILSKDLVSTIIKNKNIIINKDLPEDYVLSNFLHTSLNLLPTNPSLKHMHLLEHLSSYSTSSLDKELEKADKLNCDHFRIKSKTNRENIDPRVASYIVKRYYNV